MSESSFSQSRSAPGSEPRQITPIAAVQPQHRVRVRGVITLARAMSIGGAPACRYTLTDGTGELDLLFLGRVEVIDLARGRSCSAEGMAAVRDGQTVLWNPRYWLDPAGPAQLTEVLDDSEPSAGFVLIVDDDPALRRVLHKNLAARGYRVALAGTAAAAADLAVGQPDVIVLDLGLPDMNGLKIISTLRDRCDAPIIVISGREAATRFSALSAGAADYLPKPFGIEMLVARINAIRPRLAAATSEAVISASG